MGSKFQKRYCVVSNHVMYYFKDKKANRQQGTILLPGYKAQPANKKGREFILTHPDGHRTFQVLEREIYLLSTDSRYCNCCIVYIVLAL